MRASSHSAARLGRVVPAVIFLAALSACSAGSGGGSGGGTGPVPIASATFTTAKISAAEFASNVGDKLQQQTGVTPIVDCGTADIPLLDGTVVHCDISAADNDQLHFDSTTTISNVNGGDFHIDIKVADAPKS